MAAAFDETLVDNARIKDGFVSGWTLQEWTQGFRQLEDFCVKFNS